MKRRNYLSGAPLSVLSVLFILALWQVVSVFTGSDLILPSPADVFRRIFELAGTKPFYTAVGSTLFRALAAFAVSAVLSLVLGICIGLFPAADAFFRIPLTIIKATPVVSFILLALFWFTSSTVPVFVSILMTLPVMTSASSCGIRSTGKKLLEMSAVYGFSALQKVRYLYLPSMVPWFLSGAASGIGLSWKVVVAAEVLSLPRNSVGNALQTAKVHLETADVFAWTIAVIVCSYLMELIFTRLAAFAGRLYGPDFR